MEKLAGTQHLDREIYRKEHGWLRTAVVQKSFSLLLPRLLYENSIVKKEKNSNISPVQGVAKHKFSILIFNWKLFWINTKYMYIYI